MFDTFPAEGQTHMPLSTISVQQWPGLQPSKFSGTRKHLHPQDQWNGFNSELPPSLGRRHWEQKYSAVGEYKPQLKVFPSVSNKTTDLTVLQTNCIKRIDFVPTQHRLRPERSHITQNKSGHLEDVPYGIKTYEIANKISNNQYGLENQLQTKTRINGLPPMRNQLEVRSLGDKAYRFPEYAPEFFKAGGLIVGSSMKDRSKKNVSEKLLTSVRVPGKLTWKEKEKLEITREDKRQVDELDLWEENTLKEANPNWKDPEKFFDNEENDINSKADPKKDSKKAGKKK